MIATLLPEAYYTLIVYRNFGPFRGYVINEFSTLSIQERR